MLTALQRLSSRPARGTQCLPSVRPVQARSRNLWFMAVTLLCRDLTEATLHGAGLSVLAAFIMMFLLIMVNWLPPASSVRASGRSCHASQGHHQLHMQSFGWQHVQGRTRNVVLLGVFLSAQAAASSGCYRALAFSLTALCSDCCPPWLQPAEGSCCAPAFRPLQLPCIGMAPLGPCCRS